MRNRVCFIGGGNMAQAMISGMIKDEFDPNNIVVIDRNLIKRELLVEKYGVLVSQSTKDSLLNTDIIVLAIKPQHMADLIIDIRDIVVDKQLIITVAAGIEISMYEKLFNKDVAIARVMPNTPSSIGFGASGVFFTSLVGDMQKQFVVSMLRSMGIVEVVAKESDINIIAACSGSGTAYYLQFMEHMVNSSVSRGLSKEQAKVMVAQTCLGAAKMVMNSSDSIEILRANVTSKKGITAESLRVFSDAGLGDIVDKAIQANIVRSEALAIELSQEI